MNLMHKIQIAFIILVLALPLSMAIQSETSSDNALRIDFIKTDPSPLATGSAGKIYFDITNIHTSTFKNLEFRFVDKFPITAKTKSISLPEIRPQETKQIVFDISTAPGALNGNYSVGLQHNHLLFEVNKIESATFTIPVKTITRAVASTTIRTEPEIISPGSKAKIFIDFYNSATYRLRDIVIKLNFTDSIPLAPISSTSEKSIQLLSPQQSKTVAFDVIALPNAAPNVYRLPITITFNDELGIETTKKDEIGIIITSAPEYSLGSEDSQLIKAMNSKLTISVSDTGTSNLKFFELEILPSKEYNIIKQAKEYVGNLEPDDFETADFNIYPKKSGEIKIKVKAVYKDDLNQVHTDEKDISVNVYSQSEAKRFGFIKGGNIVNYIIYILLIIFVYLSYKYWKKERNIPKALKLALIGLIILILKLLNNLRWKNLKRIPRKIHIALLKHRFD